MIHGVATATTVGKQHSNAIIERSVDDCLAAIDIWPRTTDN